MNSFEQCKIEGVKVQEIVKRHLESRGNLVVDVSENKDYQKRDIDFIVYKDGAMTTLEVKKDKSLYTTLNFFIEVGFQRGNYYSTGWLKKCEAEYLCYYDTKCRKGVIVDFPLLKSLLEQYGKRKEFYDYYDQKDGVAVLLPYRVAKEHGAIIHTWEEER